MVVAWIALGESHPNIIAAKQKTNLSLDLPGRLLGMEMMMMMIGIMDSGREEEEEGKEGKEGKGENHSDDD